MSFPNPDEFNLKPNDQMKKKLMLKKKILKQILSSEARMRLNNVKMVKPELGKIWLNNILIGMATQGKIPGQITDDQLKQILLSIQQPKRDFKINRRLIPIKYNYG